MCREQNIYITDGQAKGVISPKVYQVKYRPMYEVKLVYLRACRVPRTPYKVYWAIPLRNLSYLV